MGIEKGTQKTIYKKFFDGVILSAGVDLIVRSRGLILMPILTRALGPLAYGIWSQITTSTSMISKIGNFGIATSMHRYLPGLPLDKFRRQFWMSIAVVIFGVIIFGGPLFINSKTIAVLFFGGEQNSIFVILGGILMITNVLYAHLILYYRLALRMKIYSAFLLVRGIFSTLAYALAAIVGGALIQIAIIAVLLDVLLALGATFLVVRDLGFVRPDFSVLRKYLSLGLPSVPVGFSNWFLISADRFLIAFYLGVAEVGVYNVAYTVAFWAVLTAVTPIWTVAPGAINTLWNRGDKDEALILVRLMFKYSYVLTVPLACFVIFWGDDIILLFSSKGFLAGAQIIPWVVLAYGFEYTSSFYRLIFAWYEQTKIYLLTFPIAVGVNFFSNIVLIPRYGLLGAGIATALAYGTLFVLEVILSRKYLRPEFPILPSIFSVMIGMSLGVILSMLPSNGIISLIWIILLFSILYLTGIYLFGIVKKKELLSIWNTALTQEQQNKIKRQLRPFTRFRHS